MKRPIPYIREKLMYRALLSKDETAFKMLYECYSPVLFGIISMILNDKEAKFDVLQRAMVKIWFTIDQYNPNNSSLFIWMINLTHSCAIEKLKSMNQTSSFMKPSREGFLSVLKTDEFKVFESIYLEGNKVEETALEMCLHPDQVKKVLRSAFSNLSLSPKILQN